ncbi:MAG: hypothetical protein Q9186_007622 [Xanthomendoza sp. 1 TL-2023]
MFSHFCFSSFFLANLVVFTTISTGYAVARATEDDKVAVESMNDTSLPDKGTKSTPTANASMTHWPTESPFPVALSSPASTSPNTITRPSFPRCDATSFGKNLNLTSCMQTFRAMSAYEGTKRFGMRGSGEYYEAPLPFRYQSHDGRCAVDIAATRGVVSDVISPLDLKNAALSIIQICVGVAPNEGGMITGLGENGGISMRVVPYRPNVRCGPANSGPPCKLWLAANAVDFMCSQLNKKGVALGLVRRLIAWEGNNKRLILELKDMEEPDDRDDSMMATA